jgi:DUF971 family protein
MAFPSCCRTRPAAWKADVRHRARADGTPPAPGQRKYVSGRRHVGILRLEPVGHYAVRVLFDDLHDSGIYTWAYLRQLGEEQAERWASYEAQLAARGLTRDPPARR